MADDHFKKCADDCVCADYPDLRGSCDEALDDGACDCDREMALVSFACAVDRLSASVLLLGQMIDEVAYGRDD